MSYLQRSLLKMPNKHLPPRSKAGQSRDFTPLPWTKYFSEFQDILIEESSFRIYLHGTSGPVLVLLHGGGYSALTWCLFTQEIVKKLQCRVLAIDIRGHGETNTKNDDDLSIENMTNDVVNVCSKLYGENEPLVVIGHSMGGALAVHCAQKLANCIGLVVIDVVEGSALESLASMQTFLRNRPKTFINIEHGIQWCIKSGQTHNLESARVSMPGQIKNILSGKLASSEILESCNDCSSSTTSNENSVSSELNLSPTGIQTIQEDQEEVKTDFKSPNAYTWRINLSKTEVHWKDWFIGLSELFLNTTVPKLLLLANIHGLDTALTVGQMQGKFQMQVLPKCGHAIHEDLPDKVADIIASYLVRQKLTTALEDFTASLPGC